MAILLTAAAPHVTGGYTLSITDDPALVVAAQRLRHEVFSAEFGTGFPTAVPGLDADEFDAYCDHVIVRDEASRAVVGTYRLLPPDRRAWLGRSYAEAEFDLSALSPLRDHLVEIGRACVHPAHRTGTVINLLWSGITRYLHLRGLRWLGGCASLPVADGGTAAAAVWDEVRSRHLCPPVLRVRPRRPWLHGDPARAAAPTGAGGPVPAPGRAAAMPPLLRGYLRLGAWVCGEPGYDPDFNVADLYVLLSTDRMPERYRRHFLGGQG